MRFPTNFFWNILLNPTNSEWNKVQIKKGLMKNSISKIFWHYLFKYAGTWKMWLKNATEKCDPWAGMWPPGPTFTLTAAVSRGRAPRTGGWWPCRRSGATFRPRTATATATPPPQRRPIRWQTHTVILSVQFWKMAVGFSGLAKKAPTWANWMEKVLRGPLLVGESWSKVGDEFMHSLAASTHTVSKPIHKCHDKNLENLVRPVLYRDSLLRFVKLWFWLKLSH